MNIENNKQKNQEKVEESTAYAWCIIIFLAIALLSGAYLQEICVGTEIDYWVVTYAMWFSIVGVVVTIIGTALHFAGYGGKRDEIKDIF